MSIPASTLIVVMGTPSRSVGGQLLASGVLLLSGYQDVFRARIGSTFGFFMALAFSISALVTAFASKLWVGAVICAAALCLEAWLILRWRRQS